MKCCLSFFKSPSAILKYQNTPTDAANSFFCFKYILSYFAFLPEMLFVISRAIFMKPCLKLFIALPFLLLSCGRKDKQPAGSVKRPPPQVMAVIAKTSVVANSISVPGTLTAADATEIHPEISGLITSLSFREGSGVSKGTVLARIYDADLQAQKRKLQLQLEQARQTSDRYAELQSIGGISRQDYDMATLGVSNLQADLAIVNTEIEKTYVRAPFSGKLGLRMISPGAYVTPQTILTTIQTTGDLRLDFSVPERYISLLKTGMPVQFTVAGSDQTFSAQIIATNSGIGEGTRTLDVRATVRGDQTGLTPGGFATVALAFDPDQNAIMLPSQAIIPMARGKQVAVYNNGIVRMKNVTTGVRDSSRIQVLSGIQEGDTIVTTGLMSLKDSSSATIRAITD